MIKLYAQGNPRHGFEALPCVALSRPRFWQCRLYRIVAPCGSIFNRGALHIEVHTNLPAARIVRGLDELIQIRGGPVTDVAINSNSSKLPMSEREVF